MQNPFFARNRSNAERMVRMGARARRAGRETCAHWNWVGAWATWATWATWTARPLQIRQEQKRLPPWLANDSTRGLHGRRLLWGFMLLACLCGARARAAAGSCNGAHMTLRACLCHACLCLCCMHAIACASRIAMFSLHVPPFLPCSC